MTTNKTVNVSISSFTFASLTSSMFAAIDANAIETACAAFSSAARENAEKHTPDTLQNMQDAKAACEGIVRLYNIRQELLAYYSAPTFNSFFRLALIPQKGVKCGALTASIKATAKKPCVSTWLAVYERSGVEIAHKVAYNAARDTFIALLQQNVNAQVCNEGKAPTKKELADGLTAVVAACDVQTAESKPLIMPVNAALAIAHTTLKTDRRDIRGLKPIAAKAVEEQIYDAVAGQLLRIDYHVNAKKEK